MGILDVLGAAATGAGEGINTYEGLKQLGIDRQRQEEQDRQNRIAALMERKLQGAQLQEYRNRQTRALEDDQAAEQERGERDIRAAEILHRYPDLQERYGTDFRPGASARVNLDAIIAAGEERDAAAEQQSLMEKYPGQYPPQRGALTEAQEYQRAAELFRTKSQYDENYTFADALREIQSAKGTTGEARSAEPPGRATPEGQAIERAAQAIRMGGDEAVQFLAAQMNVEIKQDETGQWYVVPGSGAPEDIKMARAVLGRANGG